jgi:HAD superfamily hydrolase (TIGR01509 family)
MKNSHSSKLAKAAQAIVFDLDGTLVDSLSVTFEAFNRGIEAFGGRRHSGHEIMRYFGPSESVILGKILGADKGAAAGAICHAYMRENVHRAPLHEGIGEMLEELKRRGLPVAIVTGRGWESTEGILKHHGLLDRFVTVIASDHVVEPKPAPHGILLAAERLRVPASEIIYVGDSHFDMKAAHRAGASSAAALWDALVDRLLLEGEGPHFWLKRPEELFGILG